MRKIAFAIIAAMLSQYQGGHLEIECRMQDGVYLVPCLGDRCSRWDDVSCEGIWYDETQTESCRSTCSVTVEQCGADLDCDCDVDLYDYALFQIQFTGPLPQ